MNDDKKQFFTSASFLMTNDCNLACTYCFDACNREKKHMTNEVAFKAIDMLVANAKNVNSGVDITFFGGEPSLNVNLMKNIILYTDEIRRKEDINFTFGIVTNATVWNDNLRKFYQIWYDTYGKVDIQVSIDGVPHIQDINRLTRGGNGSSGLVEDFLKKVDEEFCKPNDLKLSEVVHVHAVTTKQSLPYLYDSYLYYKKLGIERIWLMPLHEEDWDENDLEEFESYLRKLSDVIYDICIEENSSDAYDNYSSFRCRASKPDKPCSAGAGFCSIDTNGDIYPCHRLRYDELKLGNVFDGVDMEKKYFYESYSMNDMFGIDNCAQCSNNDCKICIGANYEQNGNFVLGFPKYCKMSKKEDEIKKELNLKLTEQGLIQPQEVAGIKEVREELDVIVEGMTEFMTNMDGEISQMKEQIQMLINSNLMLMDVIQNLTMEK